MKIGIDVSWSFFAQVNIEVVIGHRGSNWETGFFRETKNLSPVSYEQSGLGEVLEVLSRSKIMEQIFLPAAQQNLVVPRLGILLNKARYQNDFAVIVLLA